jgi:hypothetical protein
VVAQIFHISVLGINKFIKKSYFFKYIGYYPLSRQSSSLDNYEISLKKATVPKR